MDPGPPADPPPGSAALTDDDRGRWIVTTQTSRYFLDLDTHQVMRHPAVPAALLRGDGDVLTLRSIGRCEIGLPLLLYLSLTTDDVVTVRQSTQVVTIEAVPA